MLLSKIAEIIRPTREHVARLFPAILERKIMRPTHERVARPFPAILEQNICEYLCHGQTTNIEVFVKKKKRRKRKRW